MKNFDEDTFNDLFRTAKELLTSGRETEEIKQVLLERTNDIILVTSALKEAKNQHYKKLSGEGRVLISIGAACILLGFLITCVNFHSNRSFDWAMFGLTSIGIVIVAWGLFKIIG